MPFLPADLTVRRAPLDMFPHHAAYVREHGMIHVLATGASADALPRAQLRRDDRPSPASPTGTSSRLDTE